MKKIYLLFLSAIISAGSFAQTVSIVDNPGTSGNIVIGGSNYHVSESIYTETELGAGNFITAGSAIQRVTFFLNTEGLNTAVGSFKIYMKNIPLATTTLATGVYSTAGYTTVFNGTLTATPVGIVGVNLSTPFVRTAGTNLEMLIERTDNVLHTGNAFDASTGNSADGAALTTRRYNNTVLPVSGTTSLTSSNFRPAVQFIHTFAIDASVDFIQFPTTSCFNTTQTVGVYVVNAGTTNIAASAASTTLHIRGANTFSGTKLNTGVIAPGGFELINFTGVSLNNTGNNFDTAYVTLAGDGTTYNDTLTDVTSAATTLSSFPLVEDVETTLPVFGYAQSIAFGQLWTLQTGNYTNTDQTLPLVPRAPGTTSFLFDSYSGASSLGFESRLFSNCINLAPISSPVLTFWMSHDNIFPTDLDSLYVSVSTDKGVTWTRLLPGFQRPDVAATSPIWKIETVSLAAYNGQTIQIGFEGVSKYGNAFSLDDITISGVLPVSLLDFNAQRNGAVNKLSWSTSQESNSSRFIIERSTDGGRSFIEIDRVAAAGNSTTVRNYQYTDASPVKGINFYRLKLVDRDNSFKYSVVKNVRNLGSADLSFAPNPVQQLMNIKLDVEKAGKGMIIITDMSGNQVYNRNINVIPGNNNVSVETGILAQGSYIIKVQLSDESIVRKFNKL